MTTAATAFPLHWPQGWPRTKDQESDRFRATLPQALKNVSESLRLFGRDSGKPVTDLVMSSAVSLGNERPSDPGVAVWFTWEGNQVCIAVDRYATVQANLQAIHYIIEARRTELRHGTLHLVRATFSGFKALPAPAGTHWADILGVPRTATREQIDAAFKRKAETQHPDKGGTTDGMVRLNDARKLALKEIPA